MTDEENELDCSVMYQITWKPVDADIVVWLTEYRTYGFLLYEGPFTSTILFREPGSGERIIEDVENDEYKYWGDYAIDYDED